MIRVHRNGFDKISGKINADRDQNLRHCSPLPRTRESQRYLKFFGGSLLLKFSYTQSIYRATPAGRNMQNACGGVVGPIMTTAQCTSLTAPRRLAGAAKVRSTPDREESRRDKKVVWVKCSETRAPLLKPLVRQFHRALRPHLNPRQTQRSLRQHPLHEKARGDELGAVARRGAVRLRQLG